MFPTLYLLLCFGIKCALRSLEHIVIGLLTKREFATKFFKCFQWDTPFAKTLLLINRVCIFLAHWCIRCITGILGGAIYGGGGGYPLWLDPSCSADIDLTELCFWLPWQISSGWKWIRLSYIANTLSAPNVDTKMTNEQISYMANIYTFVLKERQLGVFLLEVFHFKSYPDQIKTLSSLSSKPESDCYVSLPFCHFCN